jgi:PPOX class probable F420-dependent enzyme
MTLPDHIRDFLTDFPTHAPLYAVVATTDADGAPRQAVVWYRLDGDDLILNSLAGRRWPNNLLRDPRIAVAINEPGSDERWVGITGAATPITDQPTAQADIAAMARRYHADPEEAEALIRTRFETQQRISFRVAIAAVHDHLD